MSITPRNRWKYPEWDADWQNWQDKFEDLVLGQDASVFSTIEGMKPVFKKLPQSQILENDGGVVLRILDDLVLISRTLNVALTIEAGDTILMQNGFVCAVTTPGLVGPQDTEFEILTDVPIDPDIQVFGYVDEDFNINWYNGSVLVKDEPPVRIFSFKSSGGGGGEYYAGTGLDLTVGNVFNHLNTIDAKSTRALYPISIDAQGHITGSNSAVTSLPNQYSLVLQADGGEVEGESKYTYYGSSAKTLNIIGGSNVSIAKASGQWTISSVNTTYSAGTGLSLSGTTFNHSNSVTAQGTQALYPLTYDAQGHITGAGSAVTTLPNANALTLQIKSGTSEGTSQYTYTGAAVKALNFLQGTNVTLTAGSGTLTIASTDTTYSAGTGLSLAGTTFNHSNSVTAQSTQALYPIKIDAQGHISAYGTAVTSLKNPNSLVLKIKSGTTEGTDLYTYDGDAAKTLDFKQGSNITLTEAAGSLTIAATNTTYPLTQGYIAYGNGTGITGEAALFWDSTNKRLGVGTGAPTSDIHVVGNSADMVLDEYSLTSSPFINLRRSYSNTVGNHVALPSALSIAGGINFSGSDGAAFQVGARVTWTNTGNWANSATRSAALMFEVRHEDTLTEILRIRSTGVLYGANIILADANKAGYSNEGMPLSSSGQWANIVSLAGDNCTLFGAILAASTTPVKNPNNLILKIKTGSTEGFDLYTYDGSVGKTIDIREGSNITLTEGVGILTISSVNTTYPLTQGHIAYGNGTGITGEADLFWDSTNKRLGLGTTAPETISKLHIVGGGITTSPSGIRTDTYRSNNYGIINLCRSLSNTLGVHTAVSTQTLGALAFSGSDGSAFVSGAEIRTLGASTANDWGTTGNQDARLSFYTRSAGTLAERVTISSAGYLGIGTTEPTSHITIEGNTGTTRINVFATAASPSMNIYRSYSNTIGSYTALPSNLTYAGGINMGGSNGTGWTVGVSVGWRPSGNWANDATRNGDMLLRTIHENTLALRMRIHSEGGIGYGGDLVSRDWRCGHFLASQMLDGSTAGSSQSIVAMTLGLRTTSTAENQVLKLTPSDSDTPLILANGYSYSFMVNIHGYYDDVSYGGKSWLYHVVATGPATGTTVSYSANLISSVGYVAHGSDPGSVNVYMDVAGNSNKLEIRVTPYRSNAINWVATISCGAKTKGSGVATG